MPESKRSSTLNSILGGATEEKGGKGHTTAGAGEQAFSLRADFRDGRRKRALAWSHFSDYQWTDLGDRERLEVVFGERILTIEGHNLMVLARQIDEGKLKTFEEDLTAHVMQARDNPLENEALVTKIEFFPEFEDLLKQVKGEEDDQTRHARRAQR